MPAIFKFLPLLLLSPPVFADNGKIPAAAVIFILTYAAYSISIAGGLFLLYKLIDGIKNYSELSQRDEHLSKKLVVRMMLAGAMLNPQGIVSMMTASTVGDDGNLSGQCYAYKMSFDEDISDFSTIMRNSSGSGGASSVKDAIWKKATASDGAKNDCYDKATTDFVNKLSSELHDSERTIFEKLMSEKVRFIVGLIQVIGLFFFINAWFKVWAIAEGTERQSTYKGQAVVIIMSSLIINLPKTAVLIINSYSYISF
ncbi:conserved membrane hypothetical protein [Vibrio chagasii]|nr:conserved membrane hypothetical protein [Vibrio chagasii]